MSLWNDRASVIRAGGLALLVSACTALGGAEREPLAGAHAGHGAAQVSKGEKMSSCATHMQAQRQEIQAARAALAEGRASDDPARLQALLDQAEQRLAALQEAGAEPETEMKQRLQHKHAAGQTGAAMECGCGAGEHEHGGP